MDTVEEFITYTWGERCPTKDTDDFPDLDLLSRCPICEVWEYYDAWLTTRG